MARKSAEQPTDGELNILSVLWELGPSRLSEIVEALSTERQVAPTTVATMLKIMSRKGQVERVNDGEGIRWQAKLSQGRPGIACCGGWWSGSSTARHETWCCICWRRVTCPRRTNRR
jgi:Fe2+ or Zn2+ uptake regulation protein